MYKGQKHSFEVGPSIFEGLDRPSLNPLRKSNKCQSKFEDLLMEQADDGPLTVKVHLPGFFTVVLMVVDRPESNWRGRLLFDAGMECSS
jgi:hypothetical protein